MKKIEIDEDGLMQKVNKLLQQQTYFREGMAVTPAAPGSPGITGAGYDVTGDVEGWRIADLELRVRRDHRLVRTTPLMR